MKFSFPASKVSVQHSAELKLGPLVIGELYTGGEEAKLSQLVIVNGLLTVCSPELLLGHMKTFGGGDIAVSATSFSYSIFTTFRALLFMENS